jgi:hypothetical protein
VFIVHYIEAIAVQEFTVPKVKIQF